MIFRSNFFIGKDGGDSINDKNNLLINKKYNFELLDLFPLNDNHVEIYENRITGNFLRKKSRAL
ncbi:hypothetical protein OA848_03835 [Rickettsiales bacterium]|nr:hypothetical protein [Rickettsiales bacterium]